MSQGAEEMPRGRSLMERPAYGRAGEVRQDGVIREVLGVPCV